SLLGDSWASVKGGANAKTFLELIEDVTKEPRESGNKSAYRNNPGDSLALWTRVIDTLVEIDDLERNEVGRNDFRVYARNLIRPVFDRLGWDPMPDEANNAPTNLLLRALMIKTLGRFQDPTLIEGARQRFRSFLQNSETLDKELWEPIATVV